MTVGMAKLDTIMQQWFSLCGLLCVCLENERCRCQLEVVYHLEQRKVPESDPK